MFYCELLSGLWIGGTDILNNEKFITDKESLVICPLGIEYPTGIIYVRYKSEMMGIDLQFDLLTSLAETISYSFYKEQEEEEEEEEQNLSEYNTEIIKLIGKKYYPSRGKKIDMIIKLINTKSTFKVTLGGCVIKKVNQTVILTKEY